MYVDTKDGSVRVSVKWHLQYDFGIHFECNLAINLARFADSPDTASDATAIKFASILPEQY